MRFSRSFEEQNSAEPNLDFFTWETMMNMTKTLAGIALATAMVAAPATAQEFFRIGTGGAGGTYFPIGGAIATAISAPPGSRPCDEGGQCGVPGLIAIAQSTTASVFNNAAVQNGDPTRLVRYSAEG